jgi:hypothetical protein
VQFSRSDGQVLTGAVYQHLERAISVQQMSSLEVHGNTFRDNTYSIYVESTADADPFWGSLPCVPPFTSFVDASGNWFGSSGLPGLYLNPAEYIGLGVPDELSTIYSATTQLLASSAASEFTFGANAINFGLYSCPALPAPPFPVFPVNWLPLAATDPHP